MDSNQGLNTSQTYSDIDKAAQKLYKACVFSITSQFVGLLFVALYLFYLYKKYFVFSHDLPPSSPTITRSPSFAISVSEVVLEDLNDSLPMIVFDEELKAKNSICCVCLGEFEMKEELMQVPSCQHIFHRDCIGNWLSSSNTCPLCRSLVEVVDNTRLVLPPSQRSSAVRLNVDTEIQLVAS